MKLGKPGWRPRGSFRRRFSSLISVRLFLDIMQLGMQPRSVLLKQCQNLRLGWRHLYGQSLIAYTVYVNGEKLDVLQRHSGLDGLTDLGNHINHDARADALAELLVLGQCERRRTCSLGDDILRCPIISEQRRCDV